MPNTVHQCPISPPVWFLALATACSAIGLTLLSPALPIIKTELNTTSDAVQQLLTVYLVALAIGQLVYGPISDRTGRRPILLLGAILFTLAGLLAMFSQSINLLIVLRFIQGLGAAACVAMCRAIVNDAFDREEGARQLSAIAMILAIAPALSLAFGGVLAEQAGWKGSMTVLALAGVVVLISAIRLLTETNLHPIAKINFKSVFDAYVNVLQNKVFLGWTMAGGMQLGIFFSLNAFLAYQYQRHGYTMSEFGLWFALTPVSYFLGNTANRLWFVQKGIENACMLGCILALVAVIALFITQAIGLTHALSLALPCSLFGFSNGIVLANSTIGAISASGIHAGTGTGIVGAWQTATGGIAGAIIVSLGGTQNFSVAAIAIIIMSIIAVASMAFVFTESRA